MKEFKTICAALGALLFLGACYTQHEIKADTKHEVEIKPIQINIDINVRVDKALDDFFSDIDDAA